MLLFHGPTREGVIKGSLGVRLQRERESCRIRIERKVEESDEGK